MASVLASWRLIEDVLRENSHSVFLALRKPASETQIRRLESKLAAKLPRDFVKSLRIHDGLRDSYPRQTWLFDGWSLLPISAILDHWKIITDLQAECEFPGSRHKVTRRIKNDANWRAGWVPFMDENSNKVVIDLDPGPTGKVGQVFEWSNYDGFPMRLLADSYGEWLSGIAERFSKRQFRLSEYGDILLDSD